MNRTFVRTIPALALGLFFAISMVALAQEAPTPAAPAPAAPAPAATPVFPKPDPANFTASFPTKEEVNAFLQTSWGYDETRMWQVWGIEKTEVDSISKVVILVAEKTGKQQMARLEFFALNDGKHAIAGAEIIPFGPNPFAEARLTIQQRADGPYRNAAAKDLELVEFADFQCPHCKDAQATMEKLAADFPHARIVFQNFPLSQHPQAARAAAYGLCVAQLAGNDAFFSFASAVFEAQEGLANADGATLTLNAAATKAGVEATKVQACADTQEIKDKVEAGVKLAKDLSILQTPTLVVNGRQVQLGGANYEMLKKIVNYQMKLDGIQQ